MGANVIALKALYVALGGSADDVANITTNDGMINAIAGIVTPLPAVSSTENGKVLTVVEGEWAAADLPQ